MRFAPSVTSDIPQLIDWIAADPFHHNMNPEWWLTGNDCITAFVVIDNEGPTMYARLDEEGDRARIHVQFAPESEVSKRRTVAGLIFGLEGIKRMASGKRAIVFESESPLLILFLEKIGFKSAGGIDYEVEIQEKH